MDTPPNTPVNHGHAQGAAGGGRERVPALASGVPTPDQAEALWSQAPVPAYLPPGTDEELCRLGLRVEGGHLRPWHQIPAGGRQGEGSGLGPSEDAGRGGPLLGDRLWRDAEVRRVWALTGRAAEVEWNCFVDSDPSH